MNEFLNLLESWLNQHQQWLAAAIFFTAFLESLAIAGVIIPGVAVLFFLAVLTGHGATQLSTALLMAFLGAVSGDGLSFWLGKHFKDRIHHIWPFSRYPKVLQSGTRFFETHGGKSVIIGRFIGPIRPIIPMVAGALNMSAKRFFIYNASSAIVWAPMYVLPGFLVGASLQLDVKLPPHFYPILLGSITAIAAILLLSIRIQWALQSDGAVYQRLSHHIKQYSQAHLFWKILSRHRPDIRGEFPLPSITLAGLSLTLLTLLATVVSMTSLLTPSDIQVTEFIMQLRHPLFDPLFICVTLLGNSGFHTLVFALAIALLLFRGHYAAAMHVLLAGLATMLLSHGLKDLFALARPALVNAPPTSFSFPSGHASGATVFWMLLATFIAQEQEARQRWKTYLLCLVPVLLISLSRLYLGVHWFTDVLGGILLGLLITAITRVSFSRYDKEALTVDSSTLAALIVYLVTAVTYVYVKFDGAVLKYQLL